MNTFPYCFCLCFFISVFSLSAQEEMSCPHADTVKALQAYEKAKVFLASNQDSALFYMKKSKEIFNAISCWEQSVKMSYNMAVIYGKLKEEGKADEEIKAARALAQKKLPDNSRWKGKIDLYLAEKSYKSKSFTEAEKYLINAGLIFNKASAWKDYVSAYRLLSQVYLYTQDYPKMEQSVNEAYKITREKLSSDPNLIKGIMQLYGALYYKTGDYETALSRTLEGLDVLQKNMKGRDDTAFVASYYNNIGLFYLEIGDVVKAEDYSLNALNLSLQLNERHKAATIYQNLAQFFYEKQQFEKSFSYSTKCLNILKTISDPELASDVERSMIQMNMGLARAAYEIGKKEMAFAALEQNLILHKKSQYNEEKTLMTLGQLYYKESDSIRADKYLNAALENALKHYNNGRHPTVGEIYFSMAQNAQRSKDYGKALLMLKNTYSALYNNVNSAVNIEDLANISDKNMLLKALELETEILKNQGKLNEAYKVILSAAKITDQLRNTFKTEGSRLFLQQKLIPVYEKAMELAVLLYAQRKDPALIEKCFELSEKSKSMLLLDAFRTEEARSFGDVPELLLKEERRLTRELAKKSKQLIEAQASRNEAEVQKLQQEILNLRKSWQDLEKTLETKYNSYYKLKYSDKTAGIADVQKFLKKDALLLEYFVGNKNIYLFSISKNDAQLKSFSKGTDFDEHIKTLRKSLTDAQSLKDKAKSELLYKNFTENAFAVYSKYVKAGIKDNTTEIIVIPDGLLNYIPFDVLLSEKAGSGQNYKDLAYLLYKYNIHYHYSASLMLFDIKKSRSNGRLLALAPTYSYNENSGLSDERQHTIRSSVDELPGAKQEVLSLKDIYRGKFLFDKDANEKNFKALAEKENYAVIHLAMHGWVDEKQPPLSNLVLSYTEDKDEDNLLHAYELNLLKMNADLVVLSACETGFGKYERGEGVVSIGRGFMYAGVPSVIMTLWPINDRATAMLVTEFYSQLSQGKTKSEALRAAKLNYLNTAEGKNLHPFFWAAFVCLGDDSPVRLRTKSEWMYWLLWGGLGLTFILLTGYFAAKIRKPIKISKGGHHHQD